MIDPPRYLDGEDGRLERELLATALDDTGSAAAYRRVQVAIGAGVALGIGSHAATASAAAVGKVSATVPSLVLKWSAIGLLAGTVVTGTAALVIAPPRLRAPATTNQSITERPTGVPFASRGATEQHEPVSSESVALRASAGASLVVPTAAPNGTGVAHRVQAPRSAGHGVVTNHTEGVALESGAALSPESQVPPSTSAPLTSAPTNMLAREIAVVDAARASLSRHDPGGALAQIAQHDREFPAGVLALDVAMLRIRALLMAGRRLEAQTYAQKVLAANPTGAYAALVRELLAQTNP